MIFDLRDTPDGEPLTAAVCIVGAGAAGITLALSLIDSGLEVLLLESGGPEPEDDTQALYAGRVADEQMHSPPDRYRQRRFGGSTTIWGGRCMPFDPIDFEPRAQVAHSGWPFGLDALAPYYPQANRLCEAGTFAYTVATAFDRPLPPVIPGFASEHFSFDTLECFSCPTNFAARYQHKLAAAKHLRVMLHANVTALHLDSSGKTVERATVKTLSGMTHSVSARRWVLATGGLEVARLLLASRDVLPAGIGNAHDVVGRYYMCHVAGTLSTIRLSGASKTIHHGYDVSDEGIYCRRRLALKPEVQRREGLANFVGRLHHPRITDPSHKTGVLSLLYLAKMFIPYEYGKRLHGEERFHFGTWLKHVRNVVLDPFRTFAFAWHLLRDRKLADRKFPSIIVEPKAPIYSLDFHAEQHPNPDSRVTLTDEVDALGMPRIQVDWRYTPADVETCRRAVALLAKDFETSGVGRFDYDEKDVEIEMTRYGAYGGHHIGTARMGTDPATSVVDADARVHDVDNLYIAGSAVFPTSSQANPTLTIVAMALRLADHLRLTTPKVPA
jgi:choline dehydrogenase-like flavoprotein